MHIYRQALSVQSRHKGAIIAVGNFDGVHQGHRTVIAEAGKIAKAAGLPWGVLTFEPHPRAVFQPEGAAFRLTPFRAKADAIAALGVDFMIAQKFDLKFSQQGAQNFISDYLVGDLEVHHVVAGYDFKFGHKRQGSCETLLSEGQKLGFGFTVVAAASDDGGGLYSSSRVRELVTVGDMASAREVLGHPFAIAGRVAHGDKRGRTIGFPTANVALGKYIHPKFGVYAVRAKMADGETVNGVANLGLRPTFAGAAPRLEVHLFEFDADIYGNRIEVQLLALIREEKKFDGLDALKAQIALDSEQARKILKTM